MIKTESGYVSGLKTKDGMVSIYKGIPYAAPPVGQLRWKAPEKAPAWSGVRECTEFSSSAIQLPQAPFYMYTEEFIIDTSRGYSEDSLTLNIFCPSDMSGQAKPVIVYFPGGSFVSGGSSCEIYDGEQLARHGVIFITVNFRVGTLGLWSCSELSRENPEHVSGNYQLLDQIAALKWVKNNIAAFGGDPENVTLMGQSSGSGSVLTLTTSPLADNLFKRVFAMSFDLLNMPVAATPAEGGGLLLKPLYKSLAECERLGDELGCSLEEMRAKSTDELLKIPQFHPYCLDGHVLPCTFSEGIRSGITDKYDFMVTYTAADHQVFLILKEVTDEKAYEPAMRAYFGENADRAMKLYPFKGDMKEFVLRISADRYTASVMMMATLRKNSNTWLGEFTHAMPGPEAHMWGAFHSCDVPYWLDYFTDKRKDFWTNEDFALGKELVARLAAYAKNGRPEIENAAEWGPSDGSTLCRIDTDGLKTVKLLSDEQYQLWRDVYCAN